MKFKRTVATILAAVLVTGVVSGLSVAETPEVNNALTDDDTFVVGDYEYRNTEDGNLELIRYNGSEENVVIPQTVMGKSVTAISGVWDYPMSMLPNPVFDNNQSIKSVTIPEGITGISIYAFRGCSNLEAVKLPNSLKYVGYGAFQDCNSLKSLDIPEKTELLESTGIQFGCITSSFSGCTSLQSINVGQGSEFYKSIDGVLFSADETRLLFYPHGKTEESYIIPDSVTNIWYAFEDNTHLSTLYLHKNIKSFYFSPDPYFPTKLKDIYFEGTEQEWEKIEGDIAFVPDTVTVHYNYINDTTSEPDTSDSDTPTTPDNTDKTTLDVTLKDLDSEKGLEGEALDAALFGDSDLTWDDVEKIVFTSDDLFSVEYKAEDGWRVLGDESVLRSSNDGIWSTEWTLNTADMAKDEKAVKIIAKDGTIDVTATIYMKTETPDDSDTSSGTSSDTTTPGTSSDSSIGTDNPATGIALAIAPVALAAGIVIAATKKRK